MRRTMRLAPASTTRICLWVWWRRRVSGLGRWWARRHDTPRHTDWSRHLHPSRLSIGGVCQGPSRCQWTCAAQDAAGQHQMPDIRLQMLYLKVPNRSGACRCGGVHIGMVRRLLCPVQRTLLRSAQLLAPRIGGLMTRRFWRDLCAPACV